jgi:hypothetical protein
MVRMGIMRCSMNAQSPRMLAKIYDFESLHFPPIATSTKIIAMMRKGK